MKNETTDSNSTNVVRVLAVEGHQPSWRTADCEQLISNIPHLPTSYFIYFININGFVLVGFFICPRSGNTRSVSEVWYKKRTCLQHVQWVTILRLSVIYNEREYRTILRVNAYTIFRDILTEYANNAILLLISIGFHANTSFLAMLNRFIAVGELSASDRQRKSPKCRTMGLFLFSARRDRGIGSLPREVLAPIEITAKVLNNQIRNNKWTTINNSKKS